MTATCETTVDHVPAQRLPYRPQCTCGHRFRGYDTEHAAWDGANAHAPGADRGRRTAAWLRAVVATVTAAGYLVIDNGIDDGAGWLSVRASAEPCGYYAAHHLELKHLDTNPVAVWQVSRYNSAGYLLADGRDFYNAIGFDEPDEVVALLRQLLPEFPAVADTETQYQVTVTDRDGNNVRRRTFTDRAFAQTYARHCLDHHPATTVQERDAVYSAWRPVRPAAVPVDPPADAVASPEDRCTRCGANATAEPQLHSQRHGHTPTIDRDGHRMTYLHRWDMFAPPVYAIMTHVGGGDAEDAEFHFTVTDRGMPHDLGRHLSGEKAGDMTRRAPEILADAGYPTQGSADDWIELDHGTWLIPVAPPPDQ